MSDDPYRFCVFCGADCKPNGIDEDPNAEHAADCPTSTGVYPIREQDFGPKCCHCGKGAFAGPVCMDCKEPLEMGDFYMHREIEAGDSILPGVAGAAVYEVICIGCKAKDAL